MPIDVRYVGTCSIVRADDGFDATVARMLGATVSALAARRAVTAFVLDLTDVSPVQPAAMAALWAALDVGTIPVAVVNARLSARRIARRWSGRHLLVFPTVAAAVEALAPPAATTGAPLVEGLRHEALLYDGSEQFVDSVLPFVTAALEADEPVLVAVGADKAERLRGALGADAGAVVFGDMEAIGRNPARILPAWLDFVAAHGDGRPLHGIGEVAWPEPRASEIVEALHHEALLNVAFAGRPPWSLVCPYDTTALPPQVIAAARRCHPLVVTGGVHETSEEHLRDPWPSSPFEGPLPPPAGDVVELSFDGRSLPAVARLAARRADDLGLGPAQVRDLARAVAEVATNSVVHGGGRGQARVWGEDGAVVVEVRDRGHLTEPMLGRIRPTHGAAAERGLWLANQLCDLVQIRSSATDGTVVRLHVVAR
jgi:anti-sigma regulatory factor (Ser/Thr protein kinase)